MGFRDQLPWTSSPLIVSAPMGGFAGAELAAAVSREGGLGMVATWTDPVELSDQLQQASELLRGVKSNGTTPIGVGFLIFPFTENRRSEMIEVLRKYKPAVVWLFGESQLGDYNAWTGEIREFVPESQIWIQTSSVTGALELAHNAKPDVLVMQGSDAGGHGWERGAGIVSLIPETIDALAREGLSVAVVASGGIVESRGAAAAFALGAEAVAMGTRFLASEEVEVHPLYQKQVLDASDGGQKTIRSKVFDEVRGPSIWPVVYDGRALVSETYNDHASGVSIEQIRDRHAEALEKYDRGWGDCRRAAVWSGTGVGLVNEVLPAADIVRQVRDGVKLVLHNASARWE